MKNALIDICFYYISLVSFNLVMICLCWTCSYAEKMHFGPYGKKNTDLDVIQITNYIQECVFVLCLYCNPLRLEFLSLGWQSTVWEQSHGPRCKDDNEDFFKPQLSLYPFQRRLGGVTGPAIQISAGNSPGRNTKGDKNNKSCYFWISATGIYNPETQSCITSSGYTNLEFFIYLTFTQPSGNLNRRQKTKSFFSRFL